MATITNNLSQQLTLFTIFWRILGVTAGWQRSADGVLRIMVAPPLFSSHSRIWKRLPRIEDGKHELVALLTLRSGYFISKKRGPGGFCFPRFLIRSSAPVSLSFSSTDDVYPTCWFFSRPRGLFPLFIFNFMFSFQIHVEIEASKEDSQPEEKKLACLRLEMPQFTADIVRDTIGVSLSFTFPSSP